MTSGYQFGVMFAEGFIVTYPDEDAARGAVQRMKRWPTTKHNEVVKRTMITSDWEKADG